VLINKIVPEKESAKKNQMFTSMGKIGAVPNKVLTVYKGTMALFVWLV
jgi:hypothetical protein